MVDSQIQLPADGAGKKLQTFENVVGVNTVHAEGVTAVTSAGAEITIFPVYGTVSVNQGTLNNVSQLGSLYYITGLGMGTVRVESGTVGVSQGTLNVVSQLGTAYYVSGLGMGTVRVESGTVGVSSGTLNNLMGGTIQVGSGTITNLAGGTIQIGFGTVGVSMGTIIPSGLGTVRVDMGTIGVSGGTIIPAGLGTIRVDMGTIGISQGTLNSVYQLGTCYYITGLGMGTVRVEYGTVNVGGLGTVAIGFGTVAVSGGTFNVQGTMVAEITEGTLNSIYQLGTCYNIIKFAAGAPIAKGTINPSGTWLFAGTANLYAGSLTPTNTPCIFRIYATLNEANTLWVTRAPGGADNTTKEYLNSANQLTANSAYMFDVNVNTSDKINLRMGNAGTPTYVCVTEIPLM